MVRHDTSAFDSTGHDTKVDAGRRRFGYEGDKRGPKTFRVVRDVKAAVEVEMEVKRQVLNGQRSFEELCNRGNGRSELTSAWRATAAEQI